jgi:putative endonuclease
MSGNLISGKRGEDMATDYLIAKGYEIIARNYRYKRSEIDIITKKEKVLIFVEVKFRSGNFYGDPEMAVDSKKEAQVLNAADNYIFENNWDGPVRFDVISILKNSSNSLIEHFEDAFG